MTAHRPLTRRSRFATSRGLDRVVFFTDAIAAIAITLLILPLVDLVPQSSEGGATPVDFIVSNGAQVISFLISFLVIARLWYAHHQLFEHVVQYTPLIAVLSVLWAFTVVVLPLPTAMTSEFEPSVFTVAFYVGTMTLSSATLTAMAFAVRGHPDAESKDNPVSVHALVGSLTITVLFVTALIVGLFFPDINYWALLVLVVAGPVGAVIERLWTRGKAG
ncbi:TMEM175 family protein [Amnibacterium flavum]|uniref:DUF1211 domain-containing protein n=1 Tax=Amnibacterium flavum TaxID=2173173 RepID=A0A2V1HUA7_9MICO|nr:TMEM175 family protein [Amnibacterium flavum]PVZ96158.1 DUF1211 domain-containing protein [Amnibacterium flavum]